MKGSRKGRIVLMSTASLLHFRGVEHWLMEVSTRLCKLADATIVTYTVGLRDILRIPLADIVNRVAGIRGMLSECEGHAKWYELRALSYENIMGLPKAAERFLKHSGIIIPTNPIRLARIVKTSIMYMVVGDPYQAMLLSLAMTVLGVRRIILGLHSRPSYQRFIVAKPVLKLMHSVGLLKGIHAVNIIDTMILRNTLDLPVWWIPNGINCEKFRPGEKREGFQVIFVGALSEDKGIDTYLKAAELAKNKYGDVDFVVVSTGGHLKNLVVEAQSKGLVRFLGFIPQEELPRLYAESHVAVFPSKDEAFGLVSLEAQASGTPVIATDIPAFRQSIINSATGLLVKPCTPEAFADAIIRVKELWDRNKDEYMKMSMNARRNSENYCWDKIVRIYCKKFFG